MSSEGTTKLTRWRGSWDARSGPKRLRDLNRESPISQTNIVSTVFSKCVQCNVEFIVHRRANFIRCGECNREINYEYEDFYSLVFVFLRLLGSK